MICFKVECNLVFYEEGFYKVEVIVLSIGVVVNGGLNKLFMFEEVMFGDGYVFDNIINCGVINFE